MEILKFPHPRLFESCDFIPNDDEAMYILDQMWQVMLKHGGIGLAANQVGLPYRMFVMKGPNEEKISIIDPKIISCSVVPANLREGCLSAPEEFLTRSDRKEWAQISFCSPDGKSCIRVFHGIYAVCVQHEIEHLNGLSFMMSKSIPKKKRVELAKKWRLG